MSHITIDTSDITSLSTEGGSFVFKPQAEKALYALLALRDLIEEEIKKASGAIELAGTAISPSFRGVLGEKVRAVYRAYGAEFDFDPAFLESLLKHGYVSTREEHFVVSEKVRAYRKSHKKLPEGIIELPRIKKVSLIVKRDDSEKNTSLMEPPVPLDEGRDR